MSNILDIPQVPTFDPGNLQNDLHIGFGTDISQRFKAARWTDETHVLLGPGPEVKFYL